MQTISLYQTRSAPARAALLSVIAALAVVMCGASFSANYASTLQNMNAFHELQSSAAQEITAISGEIQVAGSQSLTFISSEAYQTISIVSSDTNLEIHVLAQYTFGELILASIMVPVVVYIASATFPGAIYSASNANETGWSSTNKDLWNNVFPLMVIVVAILIPVSFVIGPTSGAYRERGYV